MGEIPGARQGKQVEVKREAILHQATRSRRRRSASAVSPLAPPLPIVTGVSSACSQSLQPALPATQVTQQALCQVVSSLQPYFGTVTAQPDEPTWCIKVHLGAHSQETNRRLSPCPVSTDGSHVCRGAAQRQITILAVLIFAGHEVRDERLAQAQLDLHQVQHRDSASQPTMGMYLPACLH